MHIKDKAHIIDVVIKSGFTNKNNGVFAGIQKTRSSAVDFGTKWVCSRAHGRIFGRVYTDAFKSDIVEVFNAACRDKSFRTGAGTMLEWSEQMYPDRLDLSSETQLWKASSTVLAKINSISGKIFWAHVAWRCRTWQPNPRFLLNVREMLHCKTHGTLLKKIIPFLNTRIHPMTLTIPSRRTLIQLSKNYAQKHIVLPCMTNNVLQSREQWSLSPQPDRLLCNGKLRIFPLFWFWIFLNYC